VPITVDDLIDQVRDQCDESNTTDLSPADILQCLNRAQRKAANIIAKHLEDLLIEDVDVTTTASVDAYDVPEDAFGLRVDHIVCVSNTREFPLKRIKYRDLYKYAGTATTGVPQVYALKGKQYVIRPMPAAGTVLKLWYTKAPETLVTSQGRITTTPLANSATVDTVGSDLDTATAALKAFVNIVDAQSGKIKVSLQLNSVTSSTGALTFKSTGLTYPTVYNRTIATAVPSTVEVNDYVCAIQGTCVPDLPDACLDFYVQYAVSEIRRRMGEDVQMEMAMLDSLEKELEHQWAGREASGRILNKAKAWTR